MNARRVVVKAEDRVCRVVGSTGCSGGFARPSARYTHVPDVEGVMRGIIGLLFYSAVALAPILAGVFIATRSPRRRDRLIGLATQAVLIGFLAGGVVGWAF